MDPLSQIRANLSFTCKNETFPEPAADAELLFQYARWMEKNNQLKQEKAANGEIERLYRIATENGHTKANINLQNGAMRRHYSIKNEEHLRFSQLLIDANVATGYYLIGIFLKQGTAGLRKDPEMALRYFRKAADEGSADAQYYVGSKLEPKELSPNIAKQMYRCAAQQAHGIAAEALAIYLQDEGQFQEALEAFQLGVLSGNETSAYALEQAFRGPKPDDELHYLALDEDKERASRYHRIGKILAGYSYASPKVTEINDIVPLPPAKLPLWNGTLKWLEERESNIPPPKPSESLIEQLAKAKQLNPATGRPLPGSPNFVHTEPTLFCESDQPCPLAGYWAAQSHWSQEIRHFKQGDILPRCWGKDFEPRFWPLPDKKVDRQWIIKWGYIGEA